MDTHFWWYLARSTGIVAWFLAIASVLWGLALSTRALGRKPTAPWLLDLHRWLGALTVVFVGVHLVALVGDSFLYFGWAELFVPMASDAYRPGAVTWGIVAFWFLVLVEGTSLAMKRIPKKVWHSIHLTSYVVAVTATAHLLTAGTDSSTPALRWAALAGAVAIVFFTIYRLLAPKAPARSIPSREQLAARRADGGGTAA
ncbi:MAG: ferric reductase-like transmembrane domain-containing protein [Acidimicrobiales bacterium]|nr:ferric reductase-like transmembrane domain-containing protein [Acidimicrobiales bacterium]MCB9373173.1 ferric reductase-like transmembrane domain-containing protein [Microthrixaceae bacterium]